MKVAIGITLIVFGALIGLYVGGYLCFFKGIIAVIEGIKNDFVATKIAIGVVKVVFSGLIGYLCAAIPIGIGWALFDD